MPLNIATNAPFQDQNEDNAADGKACQDDDALPPTNRNYAKFGYT